MELCQARNFLVLTIVGVDIAFILPQVVEFHSGYKITSQSVLFQKLPGVKLKNRWNNASWALIGS